MSIELFSLASSQKNEKKKKPTTDKYPLKVFLIKVPFPSNYAF